ncbi:Hypothetical protein R9X50_00034900 [Acrodontium crateriforme]|uniref:Mannosyltransferase n=1 Tax=Acrodontium crateriforme TaxID=150365 RepID=A0AAQ3LXM1_9PEZI|nr:Hypothetical protein R9X50_00034900 [Acrodontium crateriforme]
MLPSLYFLLAIARLYFATLPSYIHPDEHFQGPEVIIGEHIVHKNTRASLIINDIAGHVFGWPAYKTWEFTSDNPIRSVFPLWLVYAPPLTLLKWIFEGLGHDVSPMAVFYVLRTLMVLLSFVLEDWAIHELIPKKRERSLALFLVTSSYVTWTFQAHTFSNSIETIVVLWSLVLMARIRDNSNRTQARACAALAFLGVFGVFNRITFPAFIVVAGVDLIPSLFLKPARIPAMLIAGVLTTVVAIMVDTEYYTGSRIKFLHPFQSAIFTPWNNVAYNLDNANLAKHGLHPFWQHFVANLPQLIGPAFPLLFTHCRRNRLFWSGVAGIAVLSCFQHQEPRFLLPAVPLFLATVRLPKAFPRVWIFIWVAFNSLAAVLFGIYHQAGVIPVQKWIEHQPDVSNVLWWKTYSPPRWILGNKNNYITTTDLMGGPGGDMIDAVGASIICPPRSADNNTLNKTLLVAPSSAAYLDAYANSTNKPVTLTPLYTYRQHIGLDDLDFGDDGVWPTLERVVGKRGLTVYQASKKC